MVIAVLAIIWVVALTPMILRKLSERRLTTSVDSFHRQLRGLRRAYPRLAASAAHPEVALSMARMAHGGVRTSSAPVSHDSLSVTTQHLSQHDGGSSGDSFRTSATGQARSGGLSSRQRQHSSNSSKTQAVRRCRVLLVLVGTMLGFFVLGLVPSLRVLWDASLLALAATAAYLALLIHFHRRAVEREVKVVAMRDRGGELRTSAKAPAFPSSRGVSPEEEGWADYDLVDDAFPGVYEKIVAGGR